MSQALVFAGQSFLGRWLRTLLHQRGISVVATARQASPEFVACDLLNANAVKEVVRHTSPQWVFQCAGATNTTDVGNIYDLHLRGTLHLLQACRDFAPGAAIVLFGSAAEYSPMTPQQSAIDENQPTVPLSFFGGSKLAQTEMGRLAGKEWGLKVITMRPFNVIGPALPSYYFAGSLIERFRRHLANGDDGPLEVQNAGVTRDFIDVRDVADAAIRLAKQGNSAIYNVATGQESSLLELAQQLGRLAGGLHVVPGSSMSSRGGLTRSCGDASRLRNEVGWLPRWTWQQSLADMWSNVGADRS